MLKIETGRFSSCPYPLKNPIRPILRDNLQAQLKSLNFLMLLVTEMGIEQWQQ